MAGYRLTIKRLAREHGLPLSGLTYQRLITKIIEDNVRRAHEAAMRVSGLRYRRALGPALESGELKLPKYAIGIPTLRKAAESGRAISDTLRDSLTRSLRAAMTANPNDPEAAIAAMSRAVSDAMAPYAKRGEPSYPPAHVHTIAVTEVRSALDLARWEYARRFAEVNPGTSARKRWRHNGHLVREPRPHHRAMDGVEVPLGHPFLVPAPEGTVQMMHPHDPRAPASEVIGCQCSYDVLVGPDAGVRKSLTVEKDRAKPVAVGERVTRPDGSIWEKTGTYSYKKVSGGDGAPEGEAAGKAPAADAPDDRLSDEEKAVSLATVRSLKKILSRAKDYDREPDEKELKLAREAVEATSLPKSEKDRLLARVAEGKYGGRPSGGGKTEHKAPGSPAPDEPKDKGDELTPEAAPEPPKKAKVDRPPDSDPKLAGLPVGTRRTWGGEEWVKTADGWRRVAVAYPSGTFEARAVERIGPEVAAPGAMDKLLAYMKTVVPIGDYRLAVARDEFLSAIGSSKSDVDMMDRLAELRGEYYGGAEFGEGSPEERARLSPEFAEYLASSDPEDAKRRLELKKEIGTKYGVDPYDVVRWKAEIKEAEAKVDEAPSGEASDLSELGPVSLKSALERDGLVPELTADLGVGSLSDLTTDEIRRWMSTKYDLDEMPTDTSTPASKRLADRYASDPSARLKPRVASEDDWGKVDVGGPRPHWSKEFPEKLSKVFKGMRPSADLKTLASTPASVKAFGSYAAAARFVYDVEGFISKNPLTMRFHIKDVARHWAVEPRTKNLFETGRGHGSTHKPTRAGWEHKLINFSKRHEGKAVHDTMLPAERPSYCMVGAKESFARGAGDGYGNSTLILKKSSVMDRCSFTLGNSSGEPGAFKAGAAHKLLDRDRSSMIGMNKALKERCVDEKWTYLECQVWGGIDLRKDVDHIVISGREWERSTEEDRAMMVKVADACGIDLRYRDGEVLYSPKSKAPPAEAPSADPKVVEAALAVPVGTIKKDLGPDGRTAYKVKTSKYTWAACDESGRKLGGPPVKAPSKWAVTWEAVKPEEMVPTPAPAGLPKGSSKDTYTKGGKTYLRHDASIPIGGLEVRADGTRWIRTSKFTWRSVK